jgi:phage terminase large subunit-like protein
VTALPSDLLALAQRLAGLTAEQRADAIARMPAAQQQALVTAILAQPLPKATMGSTWQPTPKQLELRALLDDPVKTRIMAAGGSRSGKTTEILRWIIARAIVAPGSRHMLARHRFNAASHSLWADSLPKVLGACYPGLQVKWNRADYYIELENGSQIWTSGLDSDDRVERILGTEYLTLFLEEASQIDFRAAEVAMTRAAQKVEGLEPKVVVAENPPSKGHWTFKLFCELRHPEPPHKPLAHPEWYGWLRVNPESNAVNLPSTYLESLRTASARQVLRFYRGEFGDVGEAALWRLETIEKFRAMAQPDNLVKVIISVDPSGTAGGDNRDPVGIVAAGVSTDGVVFILEDSTISAGPAEWGKAAVSCYERWGANCIVYESNFGGEMCAAVLKAAAAAKGVLVRLKEVHASRGKSQRAEPVAAIYETGRVVHVGYFDELEDELCQFTDQGYTGPRSPNRADAAIWACTEFFGKVTQNPETRHRPMPRVAMSRGFTLQNPHHRGIQVRREPDWGKRSFDGSYSIRADRDRRRQQGREPGGGRSIFFEPEEGEQ